MTIDFEAAHLPPFSVLDEPLLAFCADEHDIHPLRGLRQFGAYSQASIKSFTPNLRIATVGPTGGRSQVGR